MGSTATAGYFRGFQKFHLVEWHDEDLVSIELIELTVRVDTVDNDVHLIPLAGISNLEPEDINPEEILGDDEILTDIDICILNGTFDLNGLWEIFAWINPDDPRASLYLDYLNKMFNLEMVGKAFTTNYFFVLDYKEAGPVETEERVLVTPNKGKSFSVLCLEKDDKTILVALCAEMLYGENGQKVYVPLNKIESVLS